MLATAIIAFREFLEAFLLIGVFLGIDRTLKLGKKKEILFAACGGILISLVLPLCVFFFSNVVAHTVSEKNIDLIEGYLLIFSGFFLAYVVFSIHEFMKNSKKKTIARVSEKMEQNIFDVSLVATIIFFVTREGFEIAILIATTSLFSTFLSNIVGLLVGFSLAAIIGIITSFTYIKLPIKRIFTYTEYGIIIIGAAMVKNGISLLFENYGHIHLNTFFSFSLPFLPSIETIPGDVINNLVGLQQEMGLVQIGIMVGYSIVIFFLFKLHKLQPQEQ